MTDSFWTPLRCFIIIFLSYKKSHCAMDMHMSEDAIMVQLITYLSSALTLMFFCPETIDLCTQ